MGTPTKGSTTASASTSSSSAAAAEPAAAAAGALEAPARRAAVCARFRNLTPPRPRLLLRLGLLGDITGITGTMRGGCCRGPGCRAARGGWGWGGGGGGRGGAGRDGGGRRGGAGRDAAGADGAGITTVRGSASTRSASAAEVRTLRGRRPGRLGGSTMRLAAGDAINAPVATACSINPVAYALAS